MQGERVAAEVAKWSQVAACEIVALDKLTSGVCQFGLRVWNFDSMGLC
jgi:hypothetical protein